MPSRPNNSDEGAEHHRVEIELDLDAIWRRLNRHAEDIVLETRDGGPDWNVAQDIQRLLLCCDGLQAQNKGLQEALAESNDPEAPAKRAALEKKLEAHQGWIDELQKDLKAAHAELGFTPANSASAARLHHAVRGDMDGNICLLRECALHRPKSGSER